MTKAAPVSDDPSPGKPRPSWLSPARLTLRFIDLISGQQSCPVVRSAARWPGRPPGPFPARAILPRTFTTRGPRLAGSPSHVSLRKRGLAAKGYRRDGRGVPHFEAKKTALGPSTPVSNARAPPGPPRPWCTCHKACLAARPLVLEPGTGAWLRTKRSHLWCPGEAGPLPLRTSLPRDFASNNFRNRRLLAASDDCRREHRERRRHAGASAPRSGPERSNTVASSPAQCCID